MEKRDRKEKRDERRDEYVEKLICMNRVSKSNKGGRKISFSAVVVVGDKRGKVGVGLGKANDVTDAIRKAGQVAKKSMKKVNLIKVKGDGGAISNITIPHVSQGEFKSASVILKPATPGTGIIAGGAVRSICECLGVTDILSKSLGSNNSLNVLKAAMDGFENLTDAATLAKRRGVSMEKLWG